MAPRRILALNNCRHNNYIIREYNYIYYLLVTLISQKHNCFISKLCVFFTKHMQLVNIEFNYIRVFYYSEIY